jgi:hypothetical protein
LIKKKKISLILKKKRSGFWPFGWSMGNLFNLAVFSDRKEYGEQEKV